MKVEHWAERTGVRKAVTSAASRGVHWAGCWGKRKADRSAAYLVAMRAQRMVGLLGDLSVAGKAEPLVQLSAVCWDGTSAAEKAVPRAEMKAVSLVCHLVVTSALHWVAPKDGHWVERWGASTVVRTAALRAVPRALLKAGLKAARTDLKKVAESAVQMDATMAAH